MKRFIPYIAVIALSLSFTGCGDTLRTIQKAATYETSPQTAEQIISTAEKTAEIGVLTFDEFLRQEWKYRVEVKQYVPKVHAFAEELRFRVPDPRIPPPQQTDVSKIPRGQMYLVRLRLATEAFRLNRTSDGEAGLRAAIATVKSQLDKAKANLESIPSLKAP